MRAFPNFRSEGMELRDYFAAKAMQGMLAESGGGALHNQDLAEFAYALADSMMKARKVPDTQTTREFTTDETLRGQG